MSKEQNGEIIGLLAEKGERVRNSQCSNLVTAGKHHRCLSNGKLRSAGSGEVTLRQHHTPSTRTHTQPGSSDEQDRQLLNQVQHEAEASLHFLFN